MSDIQIEIYLSEALDQEACKDPLIAALISRIIALLNQGITITQLVKCLNHLCEDRYQMNDDVIQYVMELLLIGRIQEAL